MDDDKAVSINRRAFFNYEILEKYEVGIVLKGTEVKSIRQGQVNLRDSFGRIEGGEVYVLNLHISPYAQGSINNVSPTRTRKLLLHKGEIKRLVGKVSQKGLTLIPIRLYFKENLVKIELALAKAKKVYDKREKIKKRELEREIRRSSKRSVTGGE